MPSSGPIAYDVQGDGPPILLVHGLTENRRMWDPLVPDLAGDHTVMRVDLPGHGEGGRLDAYDAISFGQAVAEAVAEAGIGSPLAVGHSLGGVVVTVLAAVAPVRGVVNVDQPLMLGDFADAVKAMAPDLRADAATCREAVLATLDEMTGALAGAERARVEALRRPDQEVVLGTWAMLLDGDAAELDELTKAMLAGITVPYLGVHGITPPDGYGEWLAESMPQAEVEVWPDVGHYPHLVHPERFLSRVREFEATLD